MIIGLCKYEYIYFLKLIDLCDFIDSIFLIKNGRVKEIVSLMVFLIILYIWL